MGQQIAFIFLMAFGKVIFTQVIILAKNEKARYDNLMKEIEQIKNMLLEK